MVETMLASAKELPGSMVRRGTGMDEDFCRAGVEAALSMDNVAGLVRGRFIHMGLWEEKRLQSQG